MKKTNEKINPEILAKFDTCKNAEEVLKVATDNKIKMSLEDAEKLFSQKSTKLSDEDLDKVAGGGFGVPPMAPVANSGSSDK